MLLRPTVRDLKIISYYVGILTSLIGILMVIPIVTGILLGEYERSVDFIISMSITLIFGFMLTGFSEKTMDLTWIQGMIVVALTWLFAVLFGAIPLYLSGHYAQFIDALFDAMSGFTTSGLALIRDLDHASNTVNMWRHLIMFIGGQGIAVIGLTFLVRLPGAGGAFEMYAGEGRDERVLPHVSQTSRFIWKISLIYLLVGTLALFVSFMLEGMPGNRSFFHALWVFMAAFDTGGFAPQSESILYYHSALVESITIIIMIAGGLSFGLHYTIWNNRTAEIRKNIETIVWFISIIMLTLLVFIGLSQSELFGDSSVLYRKGFYQLISAHTGTGYMTIYPSEFIIGWPPLALLAIILAMGLGASASSTAGGIKMLRIGILIKFLKHEIKKLALPESAVVIEKYHLLKDLVLQDKLVKTSFLMFSLYITSYVGGTIIVMLFGYPIDQALFESISSAANVGLSAGITSVDMPNMIKIVFIIQMWTGRLEFMSIFAIIGMLVATIRGR